MIEQYFELHIFFVGITETTDIVLFVNTDIHAMMGSPRTEITDFAVLSVNTDISSMLGSPRLYRFCCLVCKH